MQTSSNANPSRLRNPGPAGRQRGFTMIELSVVLAIGLVIILAGLKLAPALMTNSRVNSEVQNVAQLVTNTRNLYQGKYTNLSAAKIIDFNLAPADLIDNAGTGLAGNWGSIAPAKATLSGGPTDGAMQFTFANIPQAVCAQYATALLGLADEMDIGKSANLKSAAKPSPGNDTVAGGCGGAGGAAVSIVIRAM